MNKFWILGVIIFVCSSYINSSYAMDLPQTTGSITKEGCSAVNGTLVSNSSGSQNVSFCKFESNFLSIVSYNGTSCFPINSYPSPLSGKHYPVSTICDSPNLDGYATGTYYVEEMQFNIKVNSTVLTNNYLILVPENKTIDIKSACTECSAPTFLSVNFPNELLNGPFRVLENGIETNFDVKKMEENTTVTVKLDLQIPAEAGNESSVVAAGSDIEIVGTQMVPEFPVSVLILVIGIISMIAIQRLYFVR